MKYTHMALLDVVANLALDADESGFDITARALRLIVRGSAHPLPLQRMLAGLGHAILDVVDYCCSRKDLIDATPFQLARFGADPRQRDRWCDAA